MAGGKSAYLEAKMLDEALGAQDWTPPATVYIALSTSPYDPDATGTVMNEVVGGSYARVMVTNDLTTFPAAVGSNPASKQVGIDINFPTATADWGTALSGYVIDAATLGNILYGADVTGGGLPIPSGTTPKIPAGTWTLSEK